MQVECNRPGCRFCAGDSSQLHCDGCHAPLGQAEPGKPTLGYPCLRIRQRTRDNGGRCKCPVGHHRVVMLMGSFRFSSIGTMGR
jgi:hypothetical protein